MVDGEYGGADFRVVIPLVNVSVGANVVDFDYTAVLMLISRVLTLWCWCAGERYGWREILRFESEE